MMMIMISYFIDLIIIDKLTLLRAERRRCEARREIFATPGLVTARQSILGPPAEGRPGPSVSKNLKV